jgi:hypothetical protein
MRRRQQHGVDGGVGKHLVKSAVRSRRCRLAKIPCGSDVGLDGADNFQPRMSMRGVCEIAAPAAEADDGAADHPEIPDETGGCRIAEMTAALSA